MPKYPNKILWVDLESSGLDLERDHILEVGAILTDDELNELTGYQAAIQLTPAAIQRIKTDKWIQDTHLENGLLKECKHSTVTLRDAELEIIDSVLLKNDCVPGEVMLAGGGVSHFDMAMIRRLMPELTTWLAYFMLDVSILRRAAHMATKGNSPFPKVAASFQEGAKAHRAYADVEAHLAEARGQWDVLRQLA